MRIEGTSRNSSVGKKGDARKSSGGGQAFVIGDTADTQKAASTHARGPMTGIDAILALQGVDDPLFARRKAVKRGQLLLDVLEDMKADLLTGRVNEQKLQGLMKIIGQARGQSDPDLDALIDDIELRARVELAKLGRFPSMAR